jgi:hypothetical protein
MQKKYINKSASIRSIRVIRVLIKPMLNLRIRENNNFSFVSFVVKLKFLMRITYEA